MSTYIFYNSTEIQLNLDALWNIRVIHFQCRQLKRMMSTVQ